MSTHRFHLKLVALAAAALVLFALTLPAGAGTPAECGGLGSPVGILNGSPGSDTFQMNDPNSVCGHMEGGGDDFSHPGAQKDRVWGDSGADVFWGFGGADEFIGGPDPDILFGDDGPDKLRGNTGNDQLFGGGGDDTLWDGDGQDLIQGGPGYDTLHRCDTNNEIHSIEATFTNDC